MKRLLNILFLLGLAGGLYAQFIPGVVASSKKVEVEEEGPANMVFNGDFALGSNGWDAASALVFDDNMCYYNGDGYQSLMQYHYNMTEPMLANRNYVIEFLGIPDGANIVVAIEGIRSTGGAYVFLMEVVLVPPGISTYQFSVPGDSPQMGIRFVFCPDQGLGGAITNIIIYEDN